jgi:hypothetical protein
MKTVLEQLMELKDKINAIEIAVCGETICSDGACGCGCDEPPVEVVDETPKSAISQYVVTEDDKYAGHVHLTRVELIDFATRLTERVIDSVKKAVTTTGLDVNDLVTLELNTWNGNTIEMELDSDTLTNNINSEIEDAICLDADSISDEIDDIFGDMYLERIS